MKNVYNAPNKEAAAVELDNLEKKWELEENSQVIPVIPP